MYGKVYISLKPVSGYALTDNRKDEIFLSIDDINVHTIDPVFVDPTFIYIIPTIKVRYDSKSTILSSEALRVKVATNIAKYEDENLGTFGKVYRSSRLSSIIDSSDQSIVSNELEFKVQKRFSPILNDRITYSFPFHTALYHPYEGFTSILNSTGFTLPNYGQTMFLDDDGYGKIRIYYLSNKNKIYVNKNAGTVDYDSGNIVLKNFSPSSLKTSEMQIGVQIDERDMFPVRNQILLLSDTTISIIDDNTNAIVSVAKVSTLGDTVSINEVPILKSVVV